MKRVIWLLLLVSATSCFAQDQLKNLTEKIEAAHKHFPVEKVHLHFDKPYYSIGDTIWFKAYVVNADQNEFSRLSTILYVDLIDEANEIKETLNLPLSAGSGDGNFVLAKPLTERNYRVRAYTQWMRNFDQRYFFDKTIQVGDALAGRLVAKSTFTFSRFEGKENVTAEIKFSSLDDTNLKEKEVNYSININNKRVDKGKGITDQSGTLKIKFETDTNSLSNLAFISTSVKINDDRTVEKIIPISAADDHSSIQFFPEGGQMVTGIPSKVGFKALSSNGLGVGASGFIKDQHNNKVLSFRSEYAGMGSFEFVPQPATVYTAVILSPNGVERTVDFPRPLDRGYVLSISQPDNNNVRVKILVSQDILEESHEVILVAQSNNNIWYTSRTALKSQALSAIIPADRFPEGVVRFTVFTEAMIPVAERLIFVSHPDERLGIKLVPDKEIYAARQKVKIDIDLENSTSANMSVAVTESEKTPVNEDSELTIFSSILLNSELGGYIENPNYYFTGKGGLLKSKELDNLMLTQGWRRFEWRQILDSLPMPKFPVEKGINIHGRMLSGPKKPISKGRVMLLLPGTDGLPLDTLTDENGRFTFNNLIFADSAKFVLQARNANDRPYVITEIDQPSPAPVALKNNLTFADSTLVTYLKSESRLFDEKVKYGLLKKSDIELKEVNIRANRTVYGNKELLPNSSNLNMPGHYDYLIKANDIVDLSNLATSFYGKVPGINIVISDSPPSAHVFSSRNLVPTVNFTSYPMRVYVDGVDRGTDIGPTTINPADVATVEILKSPGNLVIYGKDGGAGVIVITTKRGNEKETVSTVVPGIRTFMYKGYSIARQFYSPNYNIETKPAMPDLRSTIYWDPNVITGQDGKASVEFFTADTPGTYRTVVEGIDASGKIGRKVITYTVK